MNINGIKCKLSSFISRGYFAIVKCKLSSFISRGYFAIVMGVVSILILFAGKDLDPIHHGILSENSPFTVFLVMSLIITWSWYINIYLTYNSGDAEDKASWSDKGHRIFSFYTVIYMIIVVMGASYHYHISHSIDPTKQDKFTGTAQTEDAKNLSGPDSEANKTSELNWNDHFVQYMLDNYRLFDAFAFILSLVFLILLGFSESKRNTEAKTIKLFGHATTILVMILAIYAFALHGVDSGDGHGGGASSHVTINWKEVPAILIVFILSELGVMLMSKASDTKEKIAEATTNMMNAEVAMKTASEKIGKASGNVDELKGIATFFQNELWREKEDLKTTLGFKDDKDLWTSLYQYVNSWSSENHSNHGHSAELLGELFVAFSGRDDEKGSVRRLDGNLTCVAADSVYADASEKWLEASEGQNVVIWAITGLLPTEFVFPSLYRGDDEDGSKPRINAFNQFVEAIKKACKNHSVCEYRRITVLEKEEFEEMRKTKDGYCPVRDSYIVRYPEIGNINTLGSEISKLIGNETGMTEALNKNVLKKIFTNATGGKRHDFFPYYEQHAPADTKVLVDDVGVVVVPNKNLKGIKNLRQKHPAAECLLEWYVNNLHRGNQAWWCVINQSNTDLLSMLKINWDGVTISAKDLLMIGEKTSDKISWKAAAISNLSYERPECIIRFETNENILNDIANSVKELCGNFGEKYSGDYKNSNQGNSFGKWKNWPKEWASGSK